MFKKNEWNYCDNIYVKCILIFNLKNFWIFIVHVCALGLVLRKRFSKMNIFNTTIHIPTQSVLILHVYVQDKN